MRCEKAILIIQQHEGELRKLGVLSLSLFGSTARDTATVSSDVDVAVRLKEIQSGFATFRLLDTIRARLREILGTHVDVVPEPRWGGPIKDAIDKDRNLAF